MELVLTIVAFIATCSFLVFNGLRRLSDEANWRRDLAALEARNLEGGERWRA